MNISDELFQKWLHCVLDTAKMQTAIIVEHNNRINLLEADVAFILRRERKIMVKIEDLQAKANDELAQIRAETDIVNAVRQVVDNQNTRLSDLQKRVDDLIASGNVTPEALQQLSDTIDAIKSTDAANAQVVADAVMAGTPTPPQS